MFCVHCGSNNEGGAKYCRQCGKPIETVNSTPANQVPLPPLKNSGKKPKSVLLYALMPVFGLFAIVALWGIIALFGEVSDSEEPSALVSFFSALIPILIALCMLAIPAGIIFALVSNSKNFDGTIKCGNCGYVGVGAKARSVWAQVLVWMLLPIFWIGILIYYLINPKFKCPSCSSTFIGLRDNTGMYSAPRGGSKAWIIVLGVFIAIAVIGILASVVLASLSGARARAGDAQVKSILSSIKAEANSYYVNHSNSYSGVCSSAETKLLTDQISQEKMQNYACNDTPRGFAASLPLSTGKYYCVDDIEFAGIEIETAIGARNSCVGGPTGNVSWEEYSYSIDGFDIRFPNKPTIETETVPPADDSSVGYTYRTYQAKDDISSFLVVKYIYTDEIDVSEPETFLRLMVSNFASSGQLLSSSYRIEDTYPEVEFLAKIDNEMVKGKIILVAQTPFLIGYDYFPSNYSESDYETFIESLKFN